MTPVPAACVAAELSRLSRCSSQWGLTVLFRNGALLSRLFYLQTLALLALAASLLLLRTLKSPHFSLSGCMPMAAHEFRTFNTDSVEAFALQAEQLCNGEDPSPAALGGWAHAHSTMLAFLNICTLSCWARMSLSLSLYRAGSPQTIGITGKAGELFLMQRVALKTTVEVINLRKAIFCEHRTHHFRHNAFMGAS